MNADASLNKVLGQSSNNLINSQYNVENAAAGTGWAVYRHDATTNAYVLDVLTDTLQRGTGYWIKSYQTPALNKLIVPGRECRHHADHGAGHAGAGLRLGQRLSVAIPVTAVAGVSRYNFSRQSLPVGGRLAGAGARRWIGLDADAKRGGDCGLAMAKQFAHWNGNAYDVHSDVAPNIGNLAVHGPVSCASAARRRGPYARTAGAEAW
ncbi:MAG: hypothetical protein U1E30_04680 [Rhodoblastus sp.]